MISFEQFNDLMQQEEAIEEFVAQVENLNIFICDSLLYTISRELIDTMITTHFDEKGQDIIFNWLYENNREGFSLSGEDDVMVTTPKELWPYISFHCK